MNKSTSRNLVIAVISLATLAGCDRPADVASHNLSVAADNFEIPRRIIFYNSITNTYMLTVEGLCAIDTAGTVRAVTLTCKTGPTEYKKHFLGLSDNVTFFAEQLSGTTVGTYHYRVMFQPQSIIPDVELRVKSGGQ
jgi:hypothetical protein